MDAWAGISRGKARDVAPYSLWNPSQWFGRNPHPIEEKLFQPLSSIEKTHQLSYLATSLILRNPFQKPSKGELFTFTLCSLLRTPCNFYCLHNHPNSFTNSRCSWLYSRLLVCWSIQIHFPSDYSNLDLFQSLEILPPWPPTWFKAQYFNGDQRCLINRSGIFP